MSVDINKEKRKGLGSLKYDVLMGSFSPSEALDREASSLLVHNSEMGLVPMATGFAKKLSFFALRRLSNRVGVPENDQTDHENLHPSTLIFGKAGGIVDRVSKVDATTIVALVGRSYYSEAVVNDSAGSIFARSCDSWDDHCLVRIWPSE